MASSKDITDTLVDMQGEGGQLRTSGESNKWGNRRSIPPCRSKNLSSNEA
eukprot:CAMPEP_0204435762 /NCGR_PEP_ID=MMETSP0470-20130426/74156_1 /ASSEMBLY_ACC=CAM_ASM_000385 /TAXON_ID=2969 /ORGANISM="Oxyrrhis marina" /LENGTH=49 /DNA_ID= /DNA_START= /DNA_END= /DNA_ORIENTATION=